MTVVIAKTENVPVATSPSLTHTPSVIKTEVVQAAPAGAAKEPACILNADDIRTAYEAGIRGRKLVLLPAAPSKTAASVMRQTGCTQRVADEELQVVGTIPGAVKAIRRRRREHARKPRHRARRGHAHPLDGSWDGKVASVMRQTNCDKVTASVELRVTGKSTSAVQSIRLKRRMCGHEKERRTTYAAATQVDEITCHLL